MSFPTDYTSILDQVQNFNPLSYAGTRNYTNGSVSSLSPYISRGVISVADVRDEVLKHFPANKIYKFLQELAWREYWQRIWQAKGSAILHDLKYPQQDVEAFGMIKSVNEACTGITAIDEHIHLLYKNGYMHNHMRMYVAALCCNIAKAHWLAPAQWMYYYLLDADVASNHLSWQWVAGSFSNKKYYCNQDNINKYTRSLQQQSFLDLPYEQLTKMAVPDALSASIKLNLATSLPQKDLPEINLNKPVLLYNAYNLDPLWRSNEDCNRILLMEPSHFSKYPMCDQTIEFIYALAKNIADMQIFYGEISELVAVYPSANYVSKEHPAFTHYPGTKDEREWMFPTVHGYYSSFSSFWKQCEKFLI